MDKLNDKGFRVLAIAQKSNPSPVGAFGVKDECDMVLIGYLAFLDPPKESTDVFAKLTPDQKARVVSALRENGHTVGFMGDGINDAAAMKSADIGISVDTAVDVAKESADIILLEKDLMVLEQGIIEGWDNVDDEFIAKPRAWDASSVGRLYDLDWAYQFHL